MIDPVDRYFAVVDDQHDVKDPFTVLRVGDSGVLRLNEDAAWVRTGLLDRIRAGDVPYGMKVITEKAAARIRERREKGIAFRYSLLVRDADPADRPIGVLREWDSAAGGTSYAETFGGDLEWRASDVRDRIERGSNISFRIVPSDAPTVHQFVESLRRRR